MYVGICIESSSTSLASRAETLTDDCMRMPVVYALAPSADILLWHCPAQLSQGCLPWYERSVMS